MWRKSLEMGFVISYLKESMIGMDFDAKGHAEYRIEDMDAIYLTLHNGFAEQKTNLCRKRRSYPTIL